MKKLVVILGPTASGKSEMAIKLAKKFEGEIISADSRQIYKGLDIGTGKVTKKQRRDIPHYLLDVASPKRIFTVVQYRKLALKAIEKIFKKGKIPILCGGTGFYIQAVVDGIFIPEVKPNWKLREELEKKTVQELFSQLKKLDPKRAKTIEKENKRRLIRALEIVKKIGRVPILVPILQRKKGELFFNTLQIGIKLSREKLREKITKRVQKMFKLGLEKEVKNLVKKYNWIPPLQTIGYQEWQDYFEGKIDKNEVKKIIIQHTIQLTKRQITWFKRDKRINWVKNYQETEKLVKKFLK